ncbi:MAG: serine hydrolase [Bacilli bacterium]|nr:serine hydrolase [Bacilli bacterium]
MMNNTLNVLRNKMITGVEKNVFPGSTFGIIYKGKTIVEVVGNKSLYPEVEANNIDTIYDLASLTKVMVTNFLIGKLLEDNRINLKDPVKKYLLEFKHEDITIIDLLTHSSGLPANVNWMEIKTSEDYLNLILNTDKEVERHSRAIYSDIGFIILGVLIEKITGETLDSLANNQIFNKLDMNNTMYNPSDIDACAPTEKEDDIYIKGIVHDKKARLFNGVAGHAGVFSTITDVTKFARLILDDGRYNGNQIISEKIINDWYKPTFQDLNGRNRTLGWVEGKTSGVCRLISNNAIYHQGFTGNRMLIDRENELAIIVLSNRIHPTRNNNKFGKFWGEFVELVYKELKIENNKKEGIYERTI